MMDGWWWDGHMGAGGWLLMTLFWVALLAVIVWAVTRIFPARGGGESGPVERPEEILDRRLARGEIDPQTYEELRAKLRASRAERG
jgi:putative membrane protein